MLPQPGDPGAGTVQQDSVVQRMGPKKPFQVRGLRAVEIDAGLIDDEAERRFALASGVDRPQEGILDPDDIGQVKVGRVQPEAPKRESVTEDPEREKQSQQG